MELNESVPEDLGKVRVKKHQRSRQKLIIRDLFSDFAKNTTLHGLRYVTEVGLTAVEKVFWVLTFLVSVVLCFILIERVWHKWWYSPVIVSFNERMVPVGEVPFPSITICPQWKCKNSAFNYTKYFEKYYVNGRYDENDTNIEEIILLEDASLVCMDYSLFGYAERYTSNKSIIDNIKKISPLLQDSLADCRWRANDVQSCKAYFEEVLTREGVCFNFNALSYNETFNRESIQHEYEYLKSTVKIKKWSFKSGYDNPGENIEIEGNEYPRRGQENGPRPDLEIILTEDSTEGDDLCNSLSNGWKIYLQHPADMPQASLYYYAVVPGQVTSLALKFSILNTSERLVDYEPEQLQCFFPEKRKLEYFTTYTADNCRLECLSKYTYERCKCVWFSMPHKNSSEICTARKRHCVYKAQNELISNKLKKQKCNCLPSCNSIQYDADILKTNYDFNKFTTIMEKMYKIKYDKNIIYSKLDVYFKEPRFVSMRRTELFGSVDFLANCGGLLGLFLGFSFLSIIEILYFCTLRLWCILKKHIKIEKKQLNQDQTKRK